MAARDPAILSAAILLLASGCTIYSPQPLVPEEEWERIESVRLEDLAAAAAADEGRSGDNVPSFDYSDGLSADEAAGLAVALNPGLVAFRAERGIAEGQLIAAGVLPNPAIAVKFVKPDVAASWTREARAVFDLVQAIIRRPIEIERARIRIEEMKWEAADREWRVAAAARGAFVDLMHAEEAQALARERRDAAAKRLAALRDRVAPIPDRVAAEADLGDAAREELRIEGERKLALQALNRLLGLPPEHATRIQKPERPLAFAPPPEGAGAVERQLAARRPDLLAAFEAYEGAEKEYQLACWKQVPNLLLGPSIERGSGDGFAQSGLEAELELPIFNRNQGGIAQKQAERERRRREYVAGLQEARAELHQAGARVEALAAEVRHYFAEIAPGLDRGMEIAEQAFSARDLGAAELNEVRDRLLAAKISILGRLRDYHRALIDFERAAGPEPRRTPGPEGSRE